DGRRTQPAKLQLLAGRKEGHATVRIAIREGRNRQVRQMFDAVGHPVDALTRIAIGPLQDKRLKSGHWRELTEGEVALLKKGAQGTLGAQGTRGSTFSGFSGTMGSRGSASRGSGSRGSGSRRSHRER